jgi:hypothetical protein
LTTLDFVGLLDSYHTEQHPVAALALDNVQAQVEVMFPLLGTRMVNVLLAVDGGSRWFSELLYDGRGALVTSDRRYAEAAWPWLPRITVTAIAELPESDRVTVQGGKK